ncbi:MAG: chemotaxis protein CheW [Deltaproteobacteria bacterium]|nr:chemotaxis protein CheW [Deltaproteobacteria bacterium]
MEQTGANTNQYLTFCLGRELFAFEIGSVREVLEMTKITPVPATPEFMRGVINLRGHVVPVIDLRKKLGMSEARDTLDTCIIICELLVDDEPASVGLVVDSVREVAEIADRDIEPAPSLGTHVSANMLQGMARQDTEFVMLLDINTVLTGNELQALDRKGHLSGTHDNASGSEIETRSQSSSMNACNQGGFVS